MTVAAVQQVRSRCPTADIAVLTDDPELLKRYIPDCRVLSTSGRHYWCRGSLLPARLRNRVSPSTVSRLLTLEDRTRSRWPRVFNVLFVAKLRSGSARKEDVENFLDELLSAHLVIVCGMGGITDVFSTYAGDLLKVLRYSTAHRIPTVMMGQGIGPLDDRLLEASAKRVLRQADLIALRESRMGSFLLDSYGVSPHRVVVTGDDAIIVARATSPASLGDAFGVNIRVSDYSEIDQDDIGRLSRVIRQAAHSSGFDILPLPISTVPGEEDLPSIVQMIGKEALTGHILHAESDLRVVDLAARCRVVLTGSYHAAVFALSMGIPVIALMKSPYYIGKFEGLRDQFGRGCELIDLNVLDFEAQLEELIDRIWSTADELRQGLHHAADRQVTLANQAYDRVVALAEARRLSSRTRRGMTEYGSWQMIAKTLTTRVFSKPDTARWSDLQNFDVDWQPRTEMIAQLIPDGLTVLEFGAGRRHLEALLPESNTYVASDLVSRGSDTFICDLNSRPLPELGHLAPDVAVFAGVLEYVANLKDVTDWLATNVGLCITSYNCATSQARTKGRFKETWRRLNSGWVNSYSHEELVTLFSKSGFTCTSAAVWTAGGDREKIFRFERER